MTRLSEAEFAAITKRNPQLVVHETVIRKRPAIEATFAKDNLSSRFETLWAQLGGPALEKEYQFHPPRLWRFDYCNREKMIAIELHGGIWSEGRHVRGGGFLRDREKMNQAQLDGWIVIELGTGQITAANLEPLIERMKG